MYYYEFYSHFRRRDFAMSQPAMSNTDGWVNYAFHDFWPHYLQTISHHRRIATGHHDYDAAAAAAHYFTGRISSFYALMIMSPEQQNTREARIALDACEVWLPQDGQPQPRHSHGCLHALEKDYHAFEPLHTRLCLSARCGLSLLFEASML